MKKRYLVLQDGTAFEGYAFGADKESVGELIFSTNMVGYIETLTNPCYYGQIVMQTFPMIGNYGIIEEDFVGEPKLHGYVVREHCEAPSNFRCEYTLDEFLKKNSIPGIFGVDTRELTNIIRDGGVVNAKICDEIPDDLEEIKAYRIVKAVENTTRKEKTVLGEGGQKSIGILDLGATLKLEEKLAAKGCKVTVLPAFTSAEEILSENFDALILSEGAGSPEENKEIIENVRALMGKTAVFGLGLGHQIMALSQGCTVTKLTYGHHGSNLPCKIAGTPRTLISSQNHIFAVDSASVGDNTVTHFNCNDSTVEGLEYACGKAMSVQFDVTADYILEMINKMTEEK